MQSSQAVRPQMADPFFPPLCVLAKCHVGLVRLEDVTLRFCLLSFHVQSRRHRSVEIIFGVIYVVSSSDLAFLSSPPAAL